LVVQLVALRLAVRQIGFPHSEQDAELIEIPIKLLPQVAANDSDIELEVQQLVTRLTLLFILNKSGQPERMKDFVEESIQFTDELVVEIDEPDRLKV